MVVDILIMNMIHAQQSMILVDLGTIVVMRHLNDVVG